MTKRVLIMAGGTGGHVFPALAVAQELQQRGMFVSWLGTKRGLEADVVPKANIDIDWISVHGLRGKGAMGWLKAPWLLSKALLQAVQVMRQRKPNVVLGMGGFVSGPGGVASWLLGHPLVIHEQNSIAGMTNRLLSRFAKKVLIAFPSAFSKSDKVELVGNPLRKKILAETEDKTVENDRPLRVLVVGGSLGAGALNEVVPQAFALLNQDNAFEVWHQSGKNKYEQAHAAYESINMNAKVTAFIDDMDAAYRWADLVICRAGALTVAELAAAGVASILVPFPFAVDDHQTTNAKFLVDADAAELIPQQTLSAEVLSGRLQFFCANRERLEHMAKNARAVARPDATQRVADICLEVACV